MPRDTDISVKATTLYYLPVETRVPLKFGPETLSSVTCARVELTVADAAGRQASGWGETPQIQGEEALRADRLRAGFGESRPLRFIYGGPGDRGGHHLASGRRLRPRRTPVSARQRN